MLTGKREILKKRERFLSLCVRGEQEMEPCKELKREREKNISVLLKNKNEKKKTTFLCSVRNAVVLC